jgi:hypothetical protein
VENTNFEMLKTINWLEIRNYWTQFVKFLFDGRVMMAITYEGGRRLISPVCNSNSHYIRGEHNIFSTMYKIVLFQNDQSMMICVIACFGSSILCPQGVE